MQGFQRLVALGLAAWLLAAGPPAARAQNQSRTPAAAPLQAEEGLVQLDFDDVELSVVIDTIARLTGKNFIYDDRVRGRVTIVSPTKVSLDQAYRVFESVLQVKGFTTVEGPGGTLKVIPLREAKESPVDTRVGRRPTPASDRYVTRLIPLRFIDAEAITNTLKPLVSKDASMVAYKPTNTVILTDAATNIRRILSILEAIDVETYKEELAVIRLKHADAGTLADQLSEIFGGEVAQAAPAPTSRRRTRRPAAAPTPEVALGGNVRFLTDERTNSLLVLASRSRLEEIRALVRKLDTPVTGGGRIQVYYLKHADAEEIAQTLNNLVSGQPASAAGGRGAQGAQPQALRAAVTELAGGATVTADPPTNSLVIQASPEGYQALVNVIQQLDIPRPQVLVEALIMEVDVTDSQALGFNGIVTITTDDGDKVYSFSSSTQSLAEEIISAASGGTIDLGDVPSGFLGSALNNATGDGTLIQAIIQASASDNSTNVLSAPHILTSDNEEAEILVGNNIPIVTSRVQSAAGVDTGLSSSVNVERQDIGVTLRVTPQISEGETVRLQIFQEITDINSGLTEQTGSAEEVGVALTNRKIENTVVVNDGDTVVIGGLISDNYNDTLTKVPFLGDIPILGWAFKTTTRRLTKTNLLVFLTPHIMRDADDLEYTSIRKREEFRRRSEQALGLGEREMGADAMSDEELSLLGSGNERNPARASLLALEHRNPLERMREIERLQAERRESERAAAEAARHAPSYAILAGVFRDAEEAQERFTELLDAGYDGALVSVSRDGAVEYEIHLGPYEALSDAERDAAIVRDSYELSPRVVVERPEPEAFREEP